MAQRVKDLEIDSETMTIHHQLEKDKVLVIVLDGHQGKAKICEAVNHGNTIIETSKGKAARINFEESELFL